MKNFFLISSIILSLLQISTSNLFAEDIKFLRCKLYATEKDFYNDFSLDFKTNEIYRIFYAKPDFFNIKIFIFVFKDIPSIYFF